MDAQEFITYLDEPAKLGKDSLGEIRQLSEEFPYCQSLRIMYLLNLHMTDQVMFSEQLKTTAAYIADRKRLKELIAELDKGEDTIKPWITKQGTGNVEVGADVEVEVDVEKSAIPEDKPEPVVPVVEQDEEARLIALKKILEDRLNEIQKEKEEAEKAMHDEDDSTRMMTKSEIIDRFIEEEPSISRPRADFFDPVKVARKSQKDEDGIVSETLANIHLKQGNTEKAIEIYRKLSLKFPEKSSYFAAQIKKITSEH